MRLLLIALLLFTYTAANCQEEGGDEPLVPRILALDTTINIARSFCEQVGNVPQGYRLAFVDNETRFAVRYVFKNDKNESLRIDYRFSLESIDTNTRRPKVPIVNFQRISGELSAITTIYNYIFGASLSPQRLISMGTQGSPITYKGRSYQYTFLPDDYEPGYWVLTFLH
jgi:hypothetical protein